VRGAGIRVSEGKDVVVEGMRFGDRARMTKEIEND
jgi:hypothetical protein